MGYIVEVREAMGLLNNGKRYVTTPILQVDDVGLLDVLMDGVNICIGSK